MAEQNEALPELPPPPLRFAIRVGDDGSRLDYSAKDMRDYATAALQELRAEVERLKADAERLDWIDRRVTDVAVRNEAAGKCLVISWNNGVDAVRVGKGHHKDWREAIDAARQPGAPGAEG